MRLLFITLSATVLFSLTIMSYADDKSDCVSSCSNEKRSKDMYCPPAGGYSDEEHRQCIDTNTAAYNDCIKGCSSTSPPPESPTPPTPETPAAQPAESDATQDASH